MGHNMSMKPAEKIKTKLKRGHEVIVISGKSKGQKGEILAINREKNRVIIKGVNLRKRFARPSQENPKGGVIEIEHSLHLSNVQYFDSKEKKPSRISFDKDKSGNKVRMSVASKRKRTID